MCHRSCVRCVSGRLKMGVLCVMNSSLSVRLFLLLALIDLYTLHFPIGFGKCSAILLDVLTARGNPSLLRTALLLPG